MATKQEVSKSVLQTMQPVDDLERLFKDCDGTIYTKVLYAKKYDGFRCFYDPSVDEFVSRRGTLYPNFGVFKEVCNRLIKTIHLMTGVKVALDGEVAHISDEFSKVQEVGFTKKPVDMSEYLFLVFDFIPPADSSLEDATLEKRLELLTLAQRVQGSMLTNVRVVPHAPVPVEWQSPEDVLAAIPEDSEGFVLKERFSKYTGGYSFAWAKAIKEKSEDLEVIDIIEGTGKLKGRVGKFVCSRNGVDVKAGPGEASHEQLKQWWDTPEEILGKTIRVLYKDINKKGTLRQPRFGGVREDK